MKSKRLAFLLTCVFVLCTPSAPAMYLPYRIVNVPVKRLVENLTEQEKTDPKAIPKIEFRLGRLYAMAYAGVICSGLQMFGSYSFFLFWNNGYEALSALDDNQDGKLDGAEL